MLGGLRSDHKRTVWTVCTDSQKKGGEDKEDGIRGFILALPWTKKE